MLFSTGEDRQSGDKGIQQQHFENKIASCYEKDKAPLHLKKYQADLSADIATIQKQQNEVAEGLSVLKTESKTDGISSIHAQGEIVVVEKYSHNRTVYSDSSDTKQTDVKSALNDTQLSISKYNSSLDKPIKIEVKENVDISSLATKVSNEKVPRISNKDITDTFRVNTFDSSSNKTAVDLTNQDTLTCHFTSTPKTDISVHNTINQETLTPQISNISKTESEAKASFSHSNTLESPSDKHVNESVCLNTPLDSNGSSVPSRETFGISDLRTTETKNCGYESSSYINVEECDSSESGRNRFQYIFISF